MKSLNRKSGLPNVNRALMGGFRVFNRRYLRKHFHTIALNRESLEQSSIADQDSIVLYANHASWWDPLVALFMADVLFPKIRMYAPIDAEAFDKYRIFGQMGFFPIHQNSLKGAKDFLKTSRRILAEPGTSIWITPEGRFADVREQGAPLMPGLGHLAAALAAQPAPSDHTRGHKVWFLPAAVEYVFWEERLPEVLIWFGKANSPQDEIDAVSVSDFGAKSKWQAALTEGLRDAQVNLAERSIARDSHAFEVIQRSESGSFFLYDWYRKLRHRMQGRRFHADHSDLLRN